MIVLVASLALTGCLGDGNSLDNAVEATTSNPGRKVADPTTTASSSTVSPSTTSGATSTTAGAASTTLAPAGAAPGSTIAPGTAGPSTTAKPTATTAKPTATTAKPPATTAKPPATTAKPPTPPVVPATTAAPAPPPPTAAPAPPPPTGTPTGGWEITVYYTPRESNHPGSPRSISGCPVSYCRSGQEQGLGSYSSAFLDLIEVEGVGLLTSGAHAGKYLNWSEDVGDSGYYITDAPASASGVSLAPFQASASSTLPFGTRFVLADCGQNTGGGQTNATACSELRNTTWTVVDRFGSNTGSKHLDLYVGVEKAGELFEDSHLYLAWRNVTVSQL